MSWRVRINFSDGTNELIDDVFRTKEEAQYEFENWCENYSAGGETLKLAGEDYCDADIINCDIWKE